MEYLYGALLLNEAGKEINEDNLEEVMEAAGLEPEKGRIKAVVSSLEGEDIGELIEGAEAVSAPAQPAEGGGASEEESEESEESEEEDGKSDEEKEEEAAEGLGQLF